MLKCDGGDAREVFERDGVVCVRELIEEKWISLLKEAMEEALSISDEMREDLTDKAAANNKNSTSKQRFLSQNRLSHRFEKFKRFSLESPLASVAAKITGSSEIRLFSDVLFVKEPGTETPTPWHHDLPYLSITGQQNCSAWVGLDPVTEATGAVKFIKGSHRWGKLYYPVRFGSEQVLDDPTMTPLPEDIDSDRYPTVCYEMQPGDVTFHHLLTVHSAGGNSSVETMRRAVALRYIGDDVVWCTRKFAANKPDVIMNDGDRLEGKEYPVAWSN